MIAVILFWTAVLLIVYPHVIFPALVALRAAGWKRPYHSAEITPRVSFLIVAHNEARGIAAKLENVLALDYPRELLEVIVASDGSDDGTNALVGAYAPQGVRLLALPRQGKIPALNAAVAQARGEVLVFSDADTILEPDAVRALLRPLADPQVGCVEGDYFVKRAAENVGQRHYSTLERQLKKWETAAGSATSAKGALFAIRRSLFQPLPSGVTDDFATSTGAIAQGYRLIFNPAAVAYEPYVERDRREFRRKVRIMTRGLRAVWLRRELLNPARSGFYAVQLFSHKVARRLVVYPLLVLLAASGLAWPQGPFYQAAFLAQVGFYTCAALGWLFEGFNVGRSKLWALPYYFCLVNAAALWASLQLLAGRRIDRWDSQREAATWSLAVGPASLVNRPAGASPPEKGRA